MLLKKVTSIVHKAFSKRKENKQQIFRKNLKALLGYTPLKKNMPLYYRAFSHSSQNEKVEHNNERLEFLGDRVLDMIVAEFLFKKYPYKNEGFLTEMKSKIVNRNVMAEVSVELNINKLLHYKKANMPYAKQSKTHIFGNTLEALIGAMFLDKQYNFTYKWVVSKILISLVSLENLEDVNINIKNKIIGWCLKNNKVLEFKTLSEEINGNKQKVFTMGVVIDGELMASAKDFTKRNAEITACYIVDKLLN